MSNWKPPRRFRRRTPTANSESSRRLGRNNAHDQLEVTKKAQAKYTRDALGIDKKAPDVKKDTEKTGDGTQ